MKYSSFCISKNSFKNVLKNLSEIMQKENLYKYPQKSVQIEKIQNLKKTSNKICYPLNPSLPGEARSAPPPLGFFSAVTFFWITFL